MRIGRKHSVLTLALLSAGLSALWAHPHVFMDSRLEFEMDGRECVGLWVEWTFDPVFSADVIGQFDADRNGAFSAAENELVRTKAFSNLRKYGYFLFIRKGDKRICPEAVDGFQASQRDGLAVYRFRVDLAGKGFSDDFSVAVFDTTFYCATRYLDPPAVASWKAGGGESEKVAIDVVQNKKYPVYYNPTGSATDSRVYHSWAKGLQTAYPEELRVHFVP